MGLTSQAAHLYSQNRYTLSVSQATSDVKAQARLLDPDHDRGRRQGQEIKLYTGFQTIFELLFFSEKFLITWKDWSGQEESECEWILAVKSFVKTRNWPFIFFILGMCIASER